MTKLGEYLYQYPTNILTTGIFEFRILKNVLTMNQLGEYLYDGSGLILDSMMDTRAGAA